MTHEEMETAVARLFESQDLLTGKVIELAEAVDTLREEANADRKTLRKAIEEMGEQAEADRAEMREAVSRMIEIAESMESNVVLLTQMQKTARQRVEKLEKRVDRIDKGTKRRKNGPKR